MFGLGATEILIIAVILLLIFGAKRLPAIGSGLGRTVKEVRNIKKELKNNDKSAVKKEETGDGESKGPEELEKPSMEGQPAQGIEDKLKQKVIQQVPGIGQVKRIKDKADQIKKIVS